MGKTKFVKVAVEERLPRFGWVIAEAENAEISTVLFSPDSNEDKFKLKYKFFLEIVPDREDEMRELLEEYVQAIENETIIVKENEDNDGWENFGGRFYDKAKKLLNELKQ
ncbi:hypothetical protein U9K52_09885 [Chryseobacterium sp. MHB01]|uniref:hypothetical protein n=1 Tax=Chryseobacterium sp. MHB01 TaxID=3109433 RepID=UPI002AFE9C81|nr:hypothetical protein [Chryseobacterium sp. MHB01]MEA1849222.1 hypothetical protein [Chryseobacterium sp. MHB01]